MTTLQFANYGGWGAWASGVMSQAVRIRNVIMCSGQGGWDPHQADYSEETLINKDIEGEITQAFKNVELALQAAGGKGWSQVYRIVTYSTDIYAQHEFIVANVQKWMPDHKPLWTELGVAHLGFKAMHFEIDVEACIE